jgi:Bacterial pre-peptidase C-terminal domain
MFKRKHLHQAVAAVFFVATGAGNLAFGITEQEPVGQMGVNDSIGTAQPLTISADGPAKGTAVVSAAIGVTGFTQTPIADVDFYSFEGKEGDLVTLDIDGGMKGTGATERHVDTLIAIFKAGSWEILAHNNDVSTSDPGSQPREGGGLRDARLDTPVRLPKDGTYVVGVSTFPRFFLNGGEMTSTQVIGGSASFPNGRYTLTIAGVTPLDVLQIVNIEVKPGNKEKPAPLNPKSKGVVRVALLSHAATANSPEFKALEVKRESITFGSTGDEKSLLRCDKDGVDVDHNGLPDLVCHFDNEAAKFEGHELMGKMKGETGNGKRFEGAGDLKVVPNGGH